MPGLRQVVPGCTVRAELHAGVAAGARDTTRCWEGAATTPDAASVLSRRMPRVRRIYALTHDELEALRRLQEGSHAPGADDPAWSYLVALGLVWMETDSQPSRLGLTSAGRSYATDE
jgi:hypothetical protein